MKLRRLFLYVLSSLFICLIPTKAYSEQDSQNMGNDNGCSPQSNGDNNSFNGECNIYNIYNIDGEAIRTLNPSNNNSLESATDYYNRGIALARDQGKYREALLDFNKAIELNREYVQAYIDRGNVYNKLQNWQQANDNYSTAITLKPRHAKAHYNRGLTYYHLGEPEAALKDFQRSSILFQEQGDNTNYQRAMERIQELQGS